MHVHYHAIFHRAPVASFAFPLRGVGPVASSPLFETAQPMNIQALALQDQKSPEARSQENTAWSQVVHNFDVSL